MNRSAAGRWLDVSFGVGMASSLDGVGNGVGSAGALRSKMAEDRLRVGFVVVWRAAILQPTFRTRYCHMGCGWTAVGES